MLALDFHHMLGYCKHPQNSISLCCLALPVILPEYLLCRLTAAPYHSVFIFGSRKKFCPSRPDRAGPHTKKVSFTSGHNAADGTQILQ